MESINGRCNCFTIANVIKVPLEKLYHGQLMLITVDGDDIISDDAKMKLLNHLRKSHGIDESDKRKTAPKKIKRNHNEFKPRSQGRSRTVNVEVRKKRTYVKRDVLENQAEQEKKEKELRETRTRKFKEILEKQKQEQQQLEAEELKKKEELRK